MNIADSRMFVSLEIIITQLKFSRVPAVKHMRLMFTEYTPCVSVQSGGSYLCSGKELNANLTSQAEIN